jgi:hypothetical protein
MPPVSKLKRYRFNCPEYGVQGVTYYIILRSRWRGGSVCCQAAQRSGADKYCRQLIQTPDIVAIFHDDILTGNK